MSAPRSPLSAWRRWRLLQRLLLDWFAACGRDLPWRSTRDAYRILVSELMAHQTQISRVVDAYDRFLARFPSVRALAEAPPAEVLRAWQGMGYNRRALHLRAAAQAALAEHGGVIPGDLASLRALPGVGDYTARAVLAFAYEQPAAPVDTNVARVLSRAVVGHRVPKADLQLLADALVPSDAAWAWSQALMDLGAVHCTAAAPKCAPCPVASACAWRLAGNAAPDPAASARRAPDAGFAGSDRFHRGRLVEAMRAGPVSAEHLASAAQLDADPQRLAGLVAGLVSQGLAEWDGDRLRLPA